MEVSENKSLITMSNEMAKASYRLTVNEIRLLLVAMAQIPKGDDTPIDENRPYYVTKEDFVRLGVPPATVAREIRSACSDLMNRKVVMDTPVGEYEFHWIRNVLHFKSEKFEELKRKYPTAKYDEDFIESLRLANLLDSLPVITKGDDNVIARLVFSTEIIPYISQLKKAFTKLNLEDLAGFGSFYSFRIYMMMMQFAKTGYVIIKLDEFRKSLDLVDKYQAVKDLKKRVLDIAVDEISQTSPYTAEYDLTDKNGKSGKGVKLTHLHIRFKAKEKPQKQALERDPNTIDWVNGATDNEAKTTPTWQTKGLSDGQINKLKVYAQEFCDSNTSKMSPSFKGSYNDLIELWKPLLKDPSTVNQFNKVQELLDRQRN